MASGINNAGTQCASLASSMGAISPATAGNVVLFASRRGHTRCSRDWSSDVCSSDLVVKIVETESRTAADLNGEVAASHAEIIALQGIHMEGGATLAQNQARDESAVFQREIIKLENGVFLQEGQRDRKSTRLNSSHGYISYAVFCLKKKKI